MINKIFTPLKVPRRRKPGYIQGSRGKTCYQACLSLHSSLPYLIDSKDVDPNEDLVPLPPDLAPVGHDLRRGGGGSRR